MIQKYINQIMAQSKLSHQEAIWLLEHITQEKQIMLLSKDLTPQQKNLLSDALHQIMHDNKPLSYIIGWIPFLDLKIKVAPPVLIPRPETEEWVNQAIIQLKPHAGQIQNILDIGTGSGAIALSLAQNFAHAHIWAIDINPKALELAQENAKLNNITNVTFLHSNLFTHLENQQFDLIVSNPPYIPEHMKDSISATVLQWEDPNALFSGPTGLNLIESILKESPCHLKYNPALPFQLVIEIDTTQHQTVQTLCATYAWSCHVTKDLFNNWRTAWCIKK